MTDTAATQFEWDILESKPAFWVGTAKRVLILLPLFAAASYGLYRFSFTQSYIKADELFIFLEIALILTFMVINYIWHIISQALPETLVHFKVGPDGVIRNKKRIPIRSLSLNTINAAFERPGSLRVLLTSGQGSIALEFSTENGKNTCWQVLRNCLTS